MDQIYVRVKRLRNSPFRRAVSGRKLFDFSLPAVDSCTEYDPSTLLDDGEWHRISDFREKSYCPEFVSQGFISVDVPELEKKQFENISYLFSVQGSDYYFQRVKPSAILRRKALVYGDTAALEEPTNRIVISPLPDAIFVAESNSLIFRDLAAISPIFPGVDSLYKEATEAQVKEFLDNDFIVAGIEPSSVSKPNRKRIALAIDTLERMSESDKVSIFSYIGEYVEGVLDFDADLNAFKVVSDDDLKTLIYGIEQRFYTTGVGEEKRLANSIVRL